MEYVLALLLGVVQGVAEFLPISSSGHLVLAERWLSSTFGSHTASLEGAAFNIAVHVGTLGSIVIVYFKRLLAAATNVRLILLVCLATLPVVVSGLLMKDTITGLMKAPQKVGFALLMTALLLALIGPLERWHGRRRDAAGTLPGPPAPDADDIANGADNAADNAANNAGVTAATSTESQVSETETSEAPPAGRTLESMTWFDALVVGLLQSIAIVPGISRAGSTIFGGVLAGMDRRAAADFSFFIAIPAIAGAAVLELKDVITTGRIEVAPDVLVWGMTVALVTGLASLQLLLKLIAKGQLIWFSVYCSLVGLTAIIAFG